MAYKNFYILYKCVCWGERARERRERERERITILTHSHIRILFSFFKKNEKKAIHRTSQNHKNSCSTIFK